MLARLTVLLLASPLVLCQLNFLSVGDWGGMELPPWYTAGEYEIATKGMPKIAHEIGAKFVLALGDNFYHAGVPNDTSFRFQSTWADVFSDDRLDFPWYPCCGNHDHKQNCTAQVAFTEKDETKRWTFPDVNYTFTESFKGSDGSDLSLQVIMIDTVLLVGMTEEDHPYAQVVPHTSEEDIRISESQFAWIEATLAASTADYIVIGGHYPVYSACTHGNTDLLVQRLEPLLERYQAVYASGHDHCLEHIVTNNTVVHVLTGAGVECCYDAHNTESVPEGALEFILAKDSNPTRTTGGFGAFFLDTTQAYVTYYNADGAELYTGNPFPPRSNKRVNEEAMLRA